MKVTTKKHSVMENGKEIKGLYYLEVDNEQGQTFTLNVGEKTYIAVKKLNELTLDKNGKPPKNSG